MSDEYTLLKRRPKALVECPKCQWPDTSFMRGQVQSDWRKCFGLPYCAVICVCCHKIIGWEKP